MDGFFIILVGLFALMAFVLMIRALGAWMLRINEVIELLKEIRDKLPKA